MTILRQKNNRLNRLHNKFKRLFFLILFAIFSHFICKATPDFDEVTVENTKIFFTHGHLFRVKYDLYTAACAAKSRNAKVLLFGHTHQPLIDFAGAGASVPLTGFGSLLAKGVREAIDKDGLMGVLSGGLTASAAGITAAIVFGLIVALVFKPKDKND